MWDRSLIFSLLDVNDCCEFVLAISGSKPGVISRNLHCHVEPCPEPVVLHVEAAFKVRNSSVLQEDELCGLATVQIKLFCLSMAILRNLK